MLRMLGVETESKAVAKADTKSTTVTKEEAAKLVDGVEWVRVSFVNVNGLLLSIALPPSRFPQITVSGLPKAYGIFGLPWMFEVLPDNCGVSVVGEGNMLPDMSTFRRLPYEGENDAMVLGEMFHRVDEADGRVGHGERMPYDTRYFMKKQMQILKEEFNLEVTAGIELEFMLYEDIDPVTKTIIPVDTLFYLDDRAYRSRGGKAVREIVNTLQKMGISVYTWHAEVGRGQYEISFAPGPVLDVVDSMVYIKQCLHAVAAKHGLRATLLPKPLFEEVGNGLHVHMSLKDLTTGKNVFPAPGTKRGFSQSAEYWTGGILQHIGAICGVSMPTTQSYMRVQPGMFASAYACWGYENREACIRVASPPYGEGCNNIELRPFDGTNNPYLAVGTYMAAGIDGLRNQTTLPEATMVDPATYTDAERKERGITHLPGSLREALDNLKADKVLMDALGEKLAQVYLAQKEYEVNFFKDIPPVDQLKFFLDKF